MSIERVIDLAGSTYGLDESEAVSVLASVERKLGRDLEKPESDSLVACLQGRKKYLDRKAGVEQKFEANLYGAAPSQPYADNDEE